jgi:hypothetical protein
MVLPCLFLVPPLYNFHLIIYLSLYYKAKGKQLPLQPVVGLSIQDMVDKIKRKRGGNSIMVAIFSIVNS